VQEGPPDFRDGQEQEQEQGQRDRKFDHGDASLC
jgi:hypothetical protein